MTVASQSPSPVLLLKEEQRRKRLAEVGADHAVKHEAEEDGSDSDGGLPRLCTPPLAWL